MKLTERNIIVTGSSGGLGPEVVRNLINSGAFCYLPQFNDTDVEKTESFLKEKGTGTGQIAQRSGVDLTDPEKTAGYYKEIAQKCTLWGVVNLAGGFGMGKIEATEAKEFDRMMNLNAKTCFNSTREGVRILRKQKKGGRIVNVASRPGEFPRQGAGLVAYTMSKAAVIALTQSVAEDVKKDNILVNAVSPSIIDTPGNRKTMPDADHKKWPNPSDIAHAIHFLLSPENNLTHGAILPVYGSV